MAAASRPVVLETAAGVRLLGAYARHKEQPGRGLAILLPGWEGSIDSTYMRCTGRALFQRGYDLFRLNYRDHGESHHLNRGIFYAVLLEEVFEAAAQAAAMAGGKPVLLAGFSLGGNFAL
ncbi:MAG: alpha/beta fold hydrolase, partial [Desulfobacterales bacterium]|nr:alpha/beta fold hydrolase [Desulfobacterales bacterium]